MVDLPHTDVPDATPGEAGRGYSMWAEEGFSGWAWFAGSLMLLVGLFQIMTGTVALAGSGYYTVPTRNLVIDAGYTTWGWVHLIWGAVMVLAGLGVLSGNLLARIIGVILAGITAVVNFAFIPVYPLWSVIVVVIAIVVIYALVAHGREMKRA